MNSHISIDDLKNIGKTAFDAAGGVNKTSLAMQSYINLLEVIRKQGLLAGLDGTTRTCPYYDDTLAASVWMQGYMSGQGS